MVDFLCKHCSRVFKDSASARRQYCSVSCHRRSRVGPANPNWKGGFKTTPERSKSAYEKHGRAWYFANKERIKARIKLKRSEINKRHRELYSKRYRDKKLAKIYNVSIDEIAKWLEIYRCQICGGSKRLAIDHDHKTGKVRGRLCSLCNSGIGLFKENSEVLIRASEYIKRTNGI